MLTAALFICNSTLGNTSPRLNCSVLLCEASVAIVVVGFVNVQEARQSPAGAAVALGCVWIRWVGRGRVDGEWFWQHAITCAAGDPPVTQQALVRLAICDLIWIELMVQS
jgi:hypothetical protein